MIKGETKFWHEIREFNIKNNCKISFTRVENSAAHGTPDLLGYNNSGHFFTIELKLNLVKKIRFSHTKLASILSIHTTVSSWPRASVRET